MSCFLKQEQLGDVCGCEEDDDLREDLKNQCRSSLDTKLRQHNNTGAKENVHLRRFISEHYLRD